MSTGAELEEVLQGLSPLVRGKLWFVTALTPILPDPILGVRPKGSSIPNLVGTVELYASAG